MKSSAPNIASLSAINLSFPSVWSFFDWRNLLRRPAASDQNFGPAVNAARTKKWKKYLPAAILLVVVVVAATIATKAIIGAFSGAKAPSGDTRYSVLGAKATANINRGFSFPIKDDKGKVVTSVKYDLETAEKRDEIIVKGERAVAVKGRTFFIVTIKLTNNYDKAISFNSRDFLRLSLNGTADLLAADIHNDPLDLQPIASKETRLGFPINDTDKNLILHVGEVTGEKTDIPVKF